jgi:succinate dehydrogenase / fumarate reductase cytochrome b subunit
MQTSRPIFLDVWRIKLPLPGLVSILHRISGVLMVLSIPIAAFLFNQALSGPDGFAATTAVLSSWVVDVALLVLTWSLVHHLIAGVRHLTLDIGLGLDRPIARTTARLALIAAPVLTILAILVGVIL